MDVKVLLASPTPHLDAACQPRILGRSIGLGKWPANGVYIGPASPHVFAKKHASRAHFVRFRGENTAFSAGQFVWWSCVFIDIVGSSFIFNIFIVSTVLRCQFNFLTFNELEFCWDWKIWPGFPLTNIFFINIVASAAAFFIFRVVGRRLTAIRSQKLTDWSAGIVVFNTITWLLYHAILKSQEKSDITGGYKMSLGNLVAGDGARSCRGCPHAHNGLVLRARRRLYAPRVRPAPEAHGGSGPAYDL